MIKERIKIEFILESKDEICRLHEITSIIETIFQQKIAEILILDDSYVYSDELIDVIKNAVLKIK